MGSIEDAVDAARAELEAESAAKAARDLQARAEADAREAERRSWAQLAAQFVERANAAGLPRTVFTAERRIPGKPRWIRSNHPDTIERIEYIGWVVHTYDLDLDWGYGHARTIVCQDGTVRTRNWRGGGGSGLSPDTNELEPQWPARYGDGLLTADQLAHACARTLLAAGVG